MENVQQSDLDRLNDKDKDELRQFINNENQRGQIRSHTHALAEICWKKCVTSSIRSGQLDSKEQSCLVNCVDRFMDMNLLTLKHLQTMRNNA